MREQVSILGEDFNSDPNKEEGVGMKIRMEA